MDNSVLLTLLPWKASNCLLHHQIFIVETYTGDESNRIFYSVETSPNTSLSCWNSVFTMIGIINIACDSPSEYYATPSNVRPLFSDRPEGRPKPLTSRQKPCERLINSQRLSTSAEALWDETIMRTMMHKLRHEDSFRKSVSCQDFFVINDDKAVGGAIPRPSTLQIPDRLPSMRRASVSDVPQRSRSESRCDKPLGTVKERQMSASKNQLGKESIRVNKDCSHDRSTQQRSECHSKKFMDYILGFCQVLKLRAIQWCCIKRANENRSDPIS
ncbi:hypothetical protein AB6A40_000491 [Gnathostoma spinigerum]|uniref:Uncharacterized protein n=1 Tax=Gnathostoma spinigerum TaxID=75299 RepID=A0ABD6E4A3_9BILA